MPSTALRLALAPATGPLADALAAIPTAVGIVREFPADALAEAEAAAAHPNLPDLDQTDVPFVTIDPAGSMDLDQALYLERSPHGYRVLYAIADVPSFVTPGGALDAESRKRGQTIYPPDGPIPLHPLILSNGAASLLPDQLRSAFVWDLALDSDANLVSTSLRRARVKSVAKLDYIGVQQAIDDGTADDNLALLKEIGLKRIQLEIARGAANLTLPETAVDEVDGGYQLVRRQPQPTEDWNAQLSLLTGMAAAELMIGAKIGILRTMPAPEQWETDRFRKQTVALGRAWPETELYGQYLRSLDTTDPRQLAIMHAAGSLFRGAGYTAFDGSVPVGLVQAAVGASYTHATAPLRRLVDRFVLVVCEAISSGTAIPTWARDALPDLPELMAHSGAVASQFEHRALDTVEAAVLSTRVGDTFYATVISLSKTGGSIQLTEPAVTAHCNGALVDGSVVRAKLVTADIPTGQVVFELA
ncbi:MAG TPA: RNB domain-containing ribonuclease [Galbitalea sp.]|nr:RNB domain-containing ribonuclease [Galbitalea sp.]